MKTNILALAGAAAALALVSAAPAAHAQDYDGYCYAKKKANAQTGTIVGAVIGGLVGSQVSKHERGLGTVGGAVVGGAIGHQVGKSSAKCLNGAYYSYESSGYYTPPPAPDGYQVVYYNERPDSSYYTQVYTTRPYAYNNSDYYSNVEPGSINNGYGYDYRGAGAREGWRDTDGYWHLGKPSAYGWRDSDGNWHQGQVQAYGWRDSQGYWHEDSTGY
jgi:hypothetical protein